MKYKKLAVLLTGTMMSLSLYTTTTFAAEYKIVPNDSLYKISTLFDTSISSLKSDNNLSSDMIYPGQVIDVPAEIYTVRSGDSLYLIAKKYGISLDALRKANNKWDNSIIPGQQLILPRVTPSSGSGTSSSSTTSGSSSAVISYSQSDVDLLARLITAEAGGESYNAMVGVGGVIVNRVQSSEWPNSISSVIYQVSGGYYQFTPVKNGYINKAPTDDAIKAAWASLYGSDPSKGAMFYFDDSSTNSWLWSKTITAYIGRMVFVK